MSLHDKFAHRAITMGKRSSEFRASAQKYANATSILVIGGGVIWYFFGWAWAVIPVALGVYTALKSVNATMVAARLEKHEQTS